MSTANDELEGKHGVQSLEVGMSILRAMATGRRSMMLKDIAQAAGMPPSKAHRYLVSLIRSGLVEQDRLTSRYDLGPFALNLGLVALDRVDRIRLGLLAINDLRDLTNETVALSVWSEGGPVVVRWERPRRPITVNVVTGTSLSLLRSAGGRVFAAWLPERQTEALIGRELDSGRTPAGVRSMDDARALLAQVRDAGLAILTGDYFARGVEAAAAPVFNFKNEITMAIAIVGVEGSMDLSPGGATLAALRRAADDLSRRLGVSPAQD
ncbi:IclR family transcriptional regulator [Thauera linaloolentis]|uniref:IclR family transcriptional regulator n=1 Tax=Thauera linaloolentis (strain DSM 12138 / JCM 21573 / CCUG 41526 / CIP 105981 / IAM 15112 / NBRC 102519 / 47Lol) TaxID=1123367 RepID=N6YCU6_THAL4|nr:IclR family transcriptional regulator [Thauera linaloolentis]ENO89330.1 IclR family transcriptional regulator [Thauera linaloolentis 47Lol = DSM 12138]MCM8565021.1 IclR family transcriptional regulator [Thauera linaloolentis]